MTLENAYIAYSGEMMKYALYFLKNHHDAEDAVSECFLRLMKPGKFLELDGEPQKAYLFAALRSVCLTELRRRGREQTVILDREPSEPAHDERSIARIDVARALAGLGERSGKVMRLRFLGGSGVRGISESLGTCESYVRVLIFRGKKQLIKELGEEYAS